MTFRENKSVRSKPLIIENNLGASYLGYNISFTFYKHIEKKVNIFQTICSIIERRGSRNHVIIICHCDSSSSSSSSSSSFKGYAMSSVAVSVIGGLSKYLFPITRLK